MNYLNILVDLITEHKDEVVRLQKLYKDLIELAPTAQHDAAVKKMDRLAKRVGLKKPSKRVHLQNGKSVKAVIMDTAGDFPKAFTLTELADQILSTGFKTSSKDPKNMIGVELGKLVKKGLFKKNGPRGKQKFTMKGGKR
jgi:hypothetical protein